MAAKGIVMQLSKDSFAETTHSRQYQQFSSMQQLVEGWVITLNVQTEVTIIAVSMCNKGQGPNQYAVGGRHVPTSQVQEQQSAVS